MRNHWTLSLVCLTLVVFLISGVNPRAGSAPAAPTLSTLQPGGFRNIAQTLNVNIVFVGYETGTGPRNINTTDYRGVLPTTYRPLHRIPAFYGIRQEIGLTFQFAYNVVFADAAYEDALFSRLSALAQPQPRTIYQTMYNDQAPRKLTIGENANHWIDAPSVENWLAANPPPGVDTSKYTVFFINWYGRADFKHHVYAKTNEPDPDTGTNFGLRHSRKIIAWGGTAHDDAEGGPSSTARVWFYDLSAGPEFWTDNWDITTADLDGDKILDYRMPPVWEYGNKKAGLYRAFNNLSRDLGLVTRYVAINLLFTTSPLYKPMISPPAVPGAINVDFNVYQANPALDGLTQLDPAYFRAKLNPLQPSTQMTTDVTSQPFASRAESIYRCFFSNVSCYGGRLFNIAFGDLFLYHDDHLTQFIEGDPDYEVPVFLFNGTDTLNAGGLLGFADDNWRDGTQTYVFGFLSPLLHDIAGYGFTTTSIHEVGHHLGMSHPHDGYDSQRNIDYGPSGPFYFAWSGDESNTIMSYVDLNADYGQFDRDNMARYLTIGYINQANAILAAIYDSQRAGYAAETLMAADAQATGALAAYAAMDYAAAAARAKRAHSGVLAAAEQIGVPVEPQSYTADYKAKGRSPKFVDTVDYKRMAQ
jgi:hypothetical protein